MRGGGLYLSRDRGENWTRVSGTLAEGFFPVVTTAEQATRLFAASATEGLYAVTTDPANPYGEPGRFAPLIRNLLFYLPL